jgi:hypothetical protein
MKLLTNNKILLKAFCRGTQAAILALKTDIPQYGFKDQTKQF